MSGIIQTTNSKSACWGSNWKRCTSRAIQSYSTAYKLTGTSTASGTIVTSTAYASTRGTGNTYTITVCTRRTSGAYRGSITGSKCTINTRATDGITSVARIGTKSAIGTAHSTNIGGKLA